MEMFFLFEKKTPESDIKPEENSLLVIFQIWLSMEYIEQ